MIDYWIQRADFSASNHTASSAEELVEVLRTHDWAEEITFCREIESNGQDSCPPGLGITLPGGRLLHFYFPNEETGVAEVVSEGGGEGTHALVPEKEWERTVTAFLAGMTLAGEEVVQEVSFAETESSVRHGFAGIPLWAWLAAAAGFAVLFLTSQDRLDRLPGDIAVFIGLASFLPWSYFRATDNTSSKYERTRGWIMLIGLGTIAVMVLLARLFGYS